MKDLFRNAPRDNPEKRMDHMEKIVTRVARRHHAANIKALVTPFPISNAVFGEKVEGVILRYMFPSDGEITKGIIKFGKKPKNEVYIGFKLSGDYEIESKGYNIIKKTILVEPGLGVKAGDCLEVSIQPDEADPVTEIWISFLWIPTVGEAYIKQVLISELEKDLPEVEGE